MSTYLTAVSTGAITALALAGAAGAQPIIVSSQANIFGAGHTLAPAPGGGGAGSLPPLISIPGSAAGGYITFAASGRVSCVGDLDSAGNGPDGGPFASGDTNILGTDGIAGIRHDSRTMFLVGVFLTGSEPLEPNPAALTVSDWNTLDRFTPGLRQPFFIGDGMQNPIDGGAIQKFFIPAGASRLYLGFADAFNFGDPVSSPGWYSDNTGELSVDYSIIPSPATGLVVLGSGLLPGRRRR